MPYLVVWHVLAREGMQMPYLVVWRLTTSCRILLKLNLFGWVVKEYEASSEAKGHSLQEGEIRMAVKK